MGGRHARLEKTIRLSPDGASGFTGRLVAEHLHQRAPNLSWAIAGRNQEKLEAIRAEYAPSADLVICDSLSIEDMRSLASSSKVVASTAGPFAQIGTPLVEACALSGTDYVDITGETQWIRDMLDAYHDIAEENGARIINCCGFDSLPSDLGTYLLADSLRVSNSQLEVIEHPYPPSGKSKWRDLCEYAKPGKSRQSERSGSSACPSFQFKSETATNAKRAIGSDGFGLRRRAKLVDDTIHKGRHQYENCTPQ